MTINYSLVSAERKPLVKAITEILETTAIYLGKKDNYAYQIGDYHLDRNGVLTGQDNRELANALAENFTAESTEFDTTEEPAVEERPSVSA